jgi:hypothetical protein
MAARRWLPVWLFGPVKPARLRYVSSDYSESEDLLSVPAARAMNSPIHRVRHVHGILGKDRSISVIVFFTV